MPLDPELKNEVVSLLFGQRFHPYRKKKGGGAASSLSVNDFHFHNLTGKRRAQGKETFIDQEDFFDPEYDCDFTDLPGSGSQCTRGDEHYERPKGWYRIGLKVKGRYQGGDAWLGNKRWRKRSERGEWPVSYHGTSLQGAKGIIRSHYNAGEGDMYGRGIYSTPDIRVAEREEYAETFTSETTGRRYKVILQNRINPENREICRRSDYWLVNVPEGTSAEEERDIVEDSIRPYGILIKEVNDDDDGDGEEHDEDDDGHEGGDYTGSGDNDGDGYDKEADDDQDQYEDDDDEDSRYDEEDDDVDNDTDSGDESDSENNDGDDGDEDYDEGSGHDSSSGDDNHSDQTDDGDDDDYDDDNGHSNDDSASDASDDDQYDDGNDRESWWDDDNEDDGYSCHDDTDGSYNDGDDNDWY